MTESEAIADFVKALHLLHSRAKDSADILKAMLDEVLKNRSNNQSLAKNDQKKIIKGIETAVIKSSIDYKKEIFDKKPNFEKKSESFEYPLEKKRMRLDSPQTSRSTSSSPTPGAALQFLPKTTVQSTIDERITTSNAVIKVEEDSEATDIEDENTDAGEFAAEMGLACVHCKQIDFTHNNQLVECQECHLLYHQECHKPPLIDQDISDPRFVWYCAKCQKTMKKIAVKPSKTNTKSPVQAPAFTAAVPQSKEYSSPSGVKTPVKSDVTSDPRLIPFKREPKVSVSNPSFQSSVSSSSSTKPIGLAALANISRSGSVSGTTSSTTKSKNGNNNNNNSSSSVTSTTSSSTSSALSVDKRLQNLKKNKTNRQK